MPRTADQARRELWLGFGDALTVLSEFLTAIAVVGAIGFGLDRLFDTWPVFFVSGVVVGNALGIYLMWLRAKNPSARRTDSGEKS